MGYCRTHNWLGQLDPCPGCQTQEIHRMLVKNQIGKASECLRAENAALIERVKDLSEALKFLSKPLPSSVDASAWQITEAVIRIAAEALEAHGWKDEG